MTIEIDDSGTGDLIGPAFILFWRRETNDLLKKKVPLNLYQSADFDAQTKLFIRDLFISTFREMDIPPTEDIYLCTGACFDEARKWLQENQYNYHDAKIEGYLQEQVEQSYLDYIIGEYSFPAKKASLESGRQRFQAIYEWVCRDFPRRQHFVKSGFYKWRTQLRAEAETSWMKQMLRPYRPPNSKRSKDSAHRNGKGPHSHNRKKKPTRKKYDRNRKPRNRPTYSSTGPNPKQKLF